LNLLLIEDYYHITYRQTFNVFLPSSWWR